MKTFDKIKQWLQGLSFRTGVIVLLCCIPFYVLSFAQMLLPHQHCCQRRTLDHPFRSGQDLPIWWADHPRRGGLSAGKELDKAKGR